MPLRHFIIAAIAASALSTAATSAEFEQPRVTVATVDWAAAAASVPNASGEPKDVFAALNTASAPRFPAIAKSGVPVLLPPDGAGGFRPSKFFLAGGAGYQATFFIQAREVTGLPIRYPRPVEVQIAGANVVHELDGPAISESETTPRGFDDFPGLRRILREAHVRFAFERFGVPYVVSIQCFNGRVTPRRLSCRDADLFAARFLRVLQTAGGTPAPQRDPPRIDLKRPDTQSALFRYYPPGALIANSGYKHNSGRVDRNVYAHIRFPLAEAPAYANSQSFMHWGDCYMKGKVGRTGRKGAPYRCRLNNKPLVFDESAAENYSYPWRDNFCETRDTQVGQCPGGYGHQGQDIRPSSCVLFNEQADRCMPYLHDIVAVRNGMIWRNSEVDVVYETAYLAADPDTDFVRFRYMHLNPKRMDADGVISGRRVQEGEIIGQVANFYRKEGGTSYHLHFDTQVFTRDGWVWVNPYMTLVAAYERLIDARGAEVELGETPDPIPAVTTPAEASAKRLSVEPKGKKKRRAVRKKKRR